MLDHGPFLSGACSRLGIDHRQPLAHHPWWREQVLLHPHPVVRVCDARKGGSVEEFDFFLLRVTVDSMEEKALCCNLNHGQQATSPGG